jgi:hypothetical protein
MDIRFDNFKLRILRAIFLTSVTFLQLTLLYGSPVKPVIARQPAGATYSKNATARFYVNAYSIDGGYLEYQWYRSAPFSAPQSGANTVKAGATALAGGVEAMLITTTPAVDGTTYYYYWVKITNNKNGDSDFVESSFALTKVVNRTLHTSLMQGDFEGMGASVSVPLGAYWNTTHDGKTPDAISGFGGNSTYPKKVLEIYPTAIYNYGNKPYNNNSTSVAELSPFAACSNYQDIATVPGKIYEWSLDHGARYNLAGDPQVMAVVIGPAINMVSDYSGFGITKRWLNDAAAPPDHVYPYGKNYTTYFYDIVNKLAKDNNTTVASLRSMPSGGAPYTVAYGGNTYYVYLSSDKKDLNFVHRSGVYTVPAGQGTTVFGFVPITLDNGAGNLIDNVIFASGSPLAPSPAITYGNTVSISASTKSGYIYGIAEVRGSSVGLVSINAGYDPDGDGASPEVAISKTAGLGIDGWYSKYGANIPFTNSGVITFKDLTPGKTYRIVGIPQLAVNTGLHVNESPEYVLDEGYYKDIRMPPAYEGNAAIIWNIDVDTYMDRAIERARARLKNARNDVEYALLADSIDKPGNHIPASRPAHRRAGWTPGTPGHVTFDSLALDSYYYLVARPDGYDETAYAAAAGNAAAPKYIKIKTPGIIVDIDENNVARNNCTSIELKNSITGYTYAVVDPETGAITGSPETGNNGSTLVFPVPDASKTYQTVTKSGDVNWLKGVRVYGCPGIFFTDCRNEAVKSSHDAGGNIPVDVEYNIRSNNAGNTWIIGAPGKWTAGIGTQPVDLASKMPGGNTVSILDSITSLNSGATLYYRLRTGLDGYTGQSVSPVREIIIPKRPAPPATAVDYAFDYINEKITVVTDSLHFAMVNISQWTSRSKNASWTFDESGWGEGGSKRPFKVRIPFTNISFASIIRTDTIPARPAAPVVDLKTNSAKSKTVITGMIDGVKYQYSTSQAPDSWIDYTPRNKTESDSIPFSPVDLCYVRFAATSAAPASFTAILTAMPLNIMPVYFINYTFGDTPATAAVTVKNRDNANIAVTAITLDGVNAGYYTLRDRGRATVPANGINSTNWELTPNSNLNAGTYNTRLKMTYTHEGTTYTMYTGVYLTVEKANWNMRGMRGYFDVSQTKARQLVLNIAGAPAGATLMYRYGSTPAAGNPESPVGSDGKTTYTFTSANGLQPSSTWPVSAIAKEDGNHNASPPEVVATGYTAYATPVFNDIFSIDYINEKLIPAPGCNPAGYTTGCASCKVFQVIQAPYSLYDILEDADNSNIVFSIVHNAGTDPPCPASEAGYSGTIQGRRAAPPVEANTVTHASSPTSYDGRIDIAGFFVYRIHETSDWLSASNSLSALGVGDYDVRYPATATAFASHRAIATVSAIIAQPSPVAAMECCIHDTLPVAIPSTVNTVEYQWYSNTSNSNTGGSAIAGATGNRFPVPAGLAAGTYYYYCKITIGGVTVLVSSAAAVKVNSYSLSGQINSVSPSTICAGGNIRLKFSGTPPYKIHCTVDNGVDTKAYSFAATAADTTIVATAGVYTFQNMLNGYVCNCAAGSFEVRVNPRVISGAAGNDETVCHGAAPKLLTSTPAAGGSSGDYSYQWIQSIDNGATWTNISNAISKDCQPDALTRTTLFRLITSDKNNMSSCDRDTGNIVAIAVRPKSLYDYPDLRIRVCPDAGTSINLSKYIDTLNVTSLKWESVAPKIPVTSAGTESISTGTIATNSLDAHTRIYTFTYTVDNLCAQNIKRKVYLEPAGNRMRPLRDSIVICHKYAGAIQINQIFGIDAGGKWDFEVIAPEAPVNIDAYVTISKSSTFGGAVIMNGKAIFENTSARKILIRYTPAGNSCLAGKEYTTKLVLTDE